VLDQASRQAGADSRRGYRGAQRIAYDHLSRVALREFVHIRGRDHRALGGIERENRHLDEIMLFRIPRIDLERARVDDVLAVVENDHFRPLVRAIDLPKHLVEHLSLRRRASECVHDHSHAVRMSLRKSHRDVASSGVVWVHAQIQPHAGHRDPRKVTFDHLVQDVLFTPIRDKDSDGRNFALSTRTAG